MKKDKKRNKLLLLAILILGISIGFAALSTTLKINGSASINKNTWNIYWNNIANKSGVTQTTEPVISEDEDHVANTLVTFDVTLDKPGDYYEFTVDAVNEGSLDAMVSNIISTVKVDDEEVTLPSYIKYSVTYADGKPIRKYHMLKKATSTTTPTRETYKIRVEFLKSISNEELASMSDTTTYNFEYKVTYNQADEYAYDRTYSFLEFSDIPGNNNPSVTVGDVVDASASTTDYTTLVDANDNQRNVFVGYKLDENRKVIQGYACGLYKDELICIPGPGTPENYDIATKRLPAIFGDYDETTNPEGCQVNGGFVCGVEGVTFPNIFINNTNTNAYVSDHTSMSQVFPMGPNGNPAGLSIIYN